MRDFKDIHDAVDLGLLLKICKSMNISNLEDNLQILTEETAKAVNADRCSIFLLDASRNLINARVMTNSWQSISFPRGKGIAGFVIDSGIEVISEDPYTDPRFNREIDRETGYVTKDIMCIPIKNSDHKIIGCIELINKKKGKFTSKDREFVVSLGEAVANMLHSTVLYNEKNELVLELERAKSQLLDKVNQMDIILKLERSHLSGDPIDYCIQSAIEEAVKATKSLAGSILLKSEIDSNVLQFSYVVGEKEQELKSLKMKSHEGLAGQILKSGVPKIENNPPKNHDHAKYIDKHINFETENIMICPLFYTDHEESHETTTIGVVEVLNSDNGAYTEEDLSFFRVICAQISSMIQKQSAFAKRERSNRLAMIGRLASTIIHDIKNPLSVVMNASQLLMEENQDESRKTKLATMIFRQSERLEAMTREVLNYIKEDMKFDFQTIDSTTFFNDFLSLLEVECELNGVSLESDIRYQGPLYVDKPKIERAIFNLTNNAFGILKPGNKLRIVCDKDQESIIIKVCDDGPGLPPEIIDTLFDAFVSKNKSDGTGLGLHIVKSIVQSHKGEVSVNKDVHSGAEFWITLPHSA